VCARRERGGTSLTWPAPKKRKFWSLRGGTLARRQAPSRAARVMEAVHSMSSLKVDTPAPRANPTHFRSSGSCSQRNGCSKRVGGKPRRPHTIFTHPPAQHALTHTHSLFSRSLVHLCTPTLAPQPLKQPEAVAAADVLPVDDRVAAIPLLYCLHHLVHELKVCRAAEASLPSERD
jgi:hypothetical protein